MVTRTKLHIPGVTVDIGDLVKDEITGFQGILVSHIRHLTGCDTGWVISRLQRKKDSEEPQQRHFDLLELVVVERNPMKVVGFPDDVPAAG